VCGGEGGLVWRSRVDAGDVRGHDVPMDCWQSSRFVVCLRCSKAKIALWRRLGRGLLNQIPNKHRAVCSLHPWRINIPLEVSSRTSTTISPQTDLCSPSVKASAHGMLEGIQLAGGRALLHFAALGAELG
jgi:hypothetical protein